MVEGVGEWSVWTSTATLSWRIDPSRCRRLPLPADTLSTSVLHEPEGGTERVYELPLRPT